jgi:hypothetical protein
MAAMKLKRVSVSNNDHTPSGPENADLGDVNDNIDDIM